MKRNFIIVGHRGVTTPQLSLNDLPGTGGRMDILTRAVNTAFCISHDIRREVEVALVLLGPEDPPKTVRFIGSRLKYLNPDERSTAALIRNALVKIAATKLKGNEDLQRDPELLELLEGELISSPGICISNYDLPFVIDHYSKKSKLIHLDEGGKDMSEFQPQDDCTFILSDHKDFTDEELERIHGSRSETISLGPLSLHTDQCITIIHNHLDRLLY
jgi:tRNA (pseudouridine54-N1)-methyltransferase